MDKLIYRFNSENNKTVLNPKEMLGGKGANLAQMAKLGLPVPPGFTISTKVCEYFFKNNKKIPKKVIQKTKKEISVVEAGDVENPSNWKTNGARMKDAMSDAIKRCAMALGVGLHLWSQIDGEDEYFLDKQLEKELNAETDKEV